MQTLLAYGTCEMVLSKSGRAFHSPHRWAAGRGLVEVANSITVAFFDTTSGYFAFMYDGDCFTFL